MKASTRFLNCPKCGDQMIAERDTFKCVRGDMSLSSHLRDGLIAVFILGTKASLQRPFRRTVGGQWYCPESGSLMIEENGFITCAECRKVLNEFILELVELHPHKRVVFDLRE